MNVGSSMFPFLLTFRVRVTQRRFSKNPVAIVEEKTDMPTIKIKDSEEKKNTKNEEVSVRFFFTVFYIFCCGNQYLEKLPHLRTVITTKMYNEYYTHIDSCKAEKVSIKVGVSDKERSLLDTKKKKKEEEALSLAPRAN